MAVRIVIIMQDDTPPAPFEPIEITTTQDSAGMANMISPAGVVDRSAMQSYLMLSVAPLADAYEAVIASPPLLKVPPQPGNPDDAPTVADPLTETFIAEWDYQKPSGGDPATGQVVHGSTTLRTLSVSIYDHAGLDRTTMLERVKPNDTITIGGTIWTVDAFSYNPAGWFDYQVTPDEQAAIDGVVDVSFVPAPLEPPVTPSPPEPLPTTIANYDYTKPDPGFPEPVAGQAVHPVKFIDTLRVAHVDFDAIDRSDVLGLVIPGDMIKIGTTTWNVDMVSRTADFTDFMVSPPVHAANIGVTPVTFERALGRRKR